MRGRFYISAGEALRALSFALLATIPSACAGTCPPPEQTAKLALVPMLGASDAARPAELPGPESSATPATPETPPIVEPDPILAALWPKATRLPLGDARVDFARYLNLIHSRIHPLFADQFLKSLDSLPTTDPLNAPALVARVSMVIDGRTGALENVTIVQSSGIAKFDAGAVGSVKRAFPTEPPPPSIWSSDGRVYATWEFRRSPEACGSWYAHPFKLAF